MSDQIKVVKPHSYRGERDSTNLLERIRMMDKYFRLAAANESGEASSDSDYAATCPRDMAINVLEDYSLGSGLHCQTAVKEALKERSMPSNHANRIRHEFFSCQQTTTVRNYNSKYSHVVIHLPSNYQDEGVLVDKYIEGLKPNIREEVGNRNPKTLFEAMRLAEAADNEFSGSQEEWEQVVRDPREELMEIGALQVPAELHGKLTPKLKRRLQKEDRCFFCRKKGHRVNDCPDEPKNVPLQC